MSAAPSIHSSFCSRCQESQRARSFLFHNFSRQDVSNKDQPPANPAIISAHARTHTPAQTHTHTLAKLHLQQVVTVFGGGMGHMRGNEGKGRKKKKERRREKVSRLSITDLSECYPCQTPTRLSSDTETASRTSRTARKNTAGHHERCDNVTGCSRRGAASVPLTQWPTHKEEAHFDERRMIWKLKKRKKKRTFQLISFLYFPEKWAPPCRSAIKKELPITRLKASRWISSKLSSYKFDHLQIWMWTHSVRRRWQRLGFSCGESKKRN